MSKLIWDAQGSKVYESGLSKGVLYNQSKDGTYPKGVSWNGLISVTESPAGAEPTDLWADDIKYGTLRSAETWGGTIEAYTYPDEFAKCDGSAEPAPGMKLNQQTREPFGFSYVTKKGNDTDPDAGYIIHLVYGATVNPSEKTRNTVNDSPEAMTMSWELSTVPVSVDGYKPVSTIDIDSTKVETAKMKAIEDILWGTNGTGGTGTGTDARLPLPNEIITTIKATGTNS